MAGGIGSRFWPLSKSTMPKQFLDILGTGRTFIQQTYDRFKKICPNENFYVVASVDYKDLVMKQLPELKEMSGAVGTLAQKYRSLHCICLL